MKYNVYKPKNNKVTCYLFILVSVCACTCMCVCVLMDMCVCMCVYVVCGWNCGPHTL